MSCEECDSNLLTAEDYTLFVKVKESRTKLYDILNKIFTLGGLIGYKTPPADAILISTNMSKTHGFDKTTIYNPKTDSVIVKQRKI